MKKARNIALALTLVLSLMLLAACGGSASSAAPASGTAAGGEASSGAPAGTGLPGEGVKVALITVMGGLGDGAIGDATYNGVVAAQEALGFELDYSEPMTAPDIEALAIEYSESGEYDLIFCAGNEALDPIEAICRDYPDQKYLVYDIEASGNEQYVSEWFAKNEIGFMAGALSALLEEAGEVTIGDNTTTFETTGIVGLIIGGEYPSTIPALTGAAAGVKYVNPEFTWEYAVVGDWEDQAKNKELALSMYDKGAHFIFQNAGGAAIGIVAAAQERGQFFVGYDMDQTPWDPERVIGSSCKENNATILRVLSTLCETGELPWGAAEENNAANGGVGFVYNPNLKLSDDVQAAMDKIYEDLKSGAIVPPNTWEDVETFDAVMAR